MTDTDALASPEPLADRLRRFLAAGCRQLGLEVGIVARVVGDTYTVVAVHCPDETIKLGDRFPLASTYCEQTVVSAAPIGFHHAQQTDWKNHPCYEAFELEAYLGARITVDDRTWGTVNFSSLLPRRKPFADVEKVVVHRISEWISAELEAQQRAAELEKILAVDDQ